MLVSSAALQSPSPARQTVDPRQAQWLNQTPVLQRGTLPAGSLSLSRHLVFGLPPPRLPPWFQGAQNLLCLRGPSPHWLPGPTSLRSPGPAAAAARASVQSAGLTHTLHLLGITGRSSNRERQAERAWITSSFIYICGSRKVVLPLYVKKYSN